jgi:hypothetical protein
MARTSGRARMAENCSAGAFAGSGAGVRRAKAASTMASARSSEGASQRLIQTETSCFQFGREEGMPSPMCFAYTDQPTS